VGGTHDAEVTAKAAASKAALWWAAEAVAVTVLSEGCETSFFFCRFAQATSGKIIGIKRQRPRPAPGRNLKIFSRTCALAAAMMAGEKN
jgi:hypothetical protein